MDFMICVLVNILRSVCASVEFKTLKVMEICLIRQFAHELVKRRRIKHRIVRAPTW